MSYLLEISHLDETYRFPVSTQTIKKTHNVHLFDNITYTIKLFENEKEIRAEKIRINGELIDSKKDNTFEGYYGWIKISAESEVGILSTGYISVMPKNKEILEQLYKMIRYIVSRSKDIEFPDAVNDLFGINSDRGNTNFKTEDLFNHILKEYDENFPLFYNNSKATLTKAMSIDSIEKLKSFSQDTARFIATHPQYLSEVKKGPIKFKDRFFTPLKTLVCSNRKDFDIYENRIVLGFLKYIIDWYQDSENILSFKDLFLLANEEKELVFDDYSELQKKFRLMHKRYKNIFGDIQDIDVDYLPSMTHIFKNVKHYQNIYRYMRLFFIGGIISPTEENIVRWYLDTSSRIYEYYVFLKLDEKIENAGYERKEIKTSSGSNLFPQYFYYEKGNKKKYLYYQPKIIFEGSTDDDKGIHIRRNTKISLSGYDSDKPYSPDYIIKSIDENDKETYEIADAKFSTFYTVREIHRPQAAFKYLLSVHTINKEKMKIKGLELYYCKDDNGTWVDPTIKKPFIKITPLL